MGQDHNTGTNVLKICQNFEVKLDKARFSQIFTITTQTIGVAWRLLKFPRASRSRSLSLGAIAMTLDGWKKSTAKILAKTVGSGSISHPRKESVLEVDFLVAQTSRGSWGWGRCGGRYKELETETLGSTSTFFRLWAEQLGSRRSKTCTLRGQYLARRERGIWRGKKIPILTYGFALKSTDPQIASPTPRDITFQSTRTLKFTQNNTPPPMSFF